MRFAPIILGGIVFGVVAATPPLVHADPPPATQPGPPQVAPEDSILSAYTPQAPPNPNPPPYTLLRFNENYHYLANPQNRTDPFDGLKYIPLNPNDSYSYLSLGGAIRERFEHYTNPNFGVGNNALVHDDHLLQRITLDADLHLNANVRFFVQGISGLQFGRLDDAPPVDEDVIDLQQAFGDLKLADSPESPDYFIIRGGRFEMSLGAGRLVATRAAPNIPFKFDGVQLIDSLAGAKIYAFLTKLAREKEYEFDDEFPDQTFWGIYGTTPPLVPRLNLKADLYYLGYKNDQASYVAGTGVEERDTFGTRLFGGSGGDAGGFDFDVEPILQTGRFDGSRILAWTVGSSFGYRFADVPMKPRLGAQLDVVSGDTRGGSFGTFNPLFFKSGYFNDASLIRPSNIIDIHPTLELLPSDDLLIVVGSDVIWRCTTNDGIYAPAGFIEIPAGGSSRYVGTTAELSVQYQINRHLSWITSYDHFFVSNTVNRLGGGDVDFLGTWITFTF